MLGIADTKTRIVPVLCLGLLQANPLGAIQTTLTVDEVAPNLYMIESSVGSNVLALRGNGRTLLVDAGPAEGVEQLQATLDSLGLDPVTHVVVTHYHDDHLAGAAWFKARGATVVAHAGTAVEAVRDTVISEWDDWHRKAANPAAMPDLTFTDEFIIRLDTTTIRLRHAPAAHTQGDAIVVFAGFGIVHTGDIYEVGAYPFIDHWAAGSVGGMIHAVNDLLDNYPSETLYVPGHGTPARRHELTRYRDMLLGVCQAVRSRIEAGDDVRAAIAAQPTAPYDDTFWGAARHGRELAALVYWSLHASAGTPTCPAAGG